MTMKLQKDSNWQKHKGNNHEIDENQENNKFKFLEARERNLRLKN